MRAWARRAHEADGGGGVRSSSGGGSSGSAGGGAGGSSGGVSGGVGSGGGGGSAEVSIEGSLVSLRCSAGDRYSAGDHAPPPPQQLPPFPGATPARISEHREYDENWDEVQPSSAPPAVPPAPWDQTLSRLARMLRARVTV